MFGYTSISEAFTLHNNNLLIINSPTFSKFLREEKPYFLLLRTIYFNSHIKHIFSGVKGSTTTFINNEKNWLTSEFTI